MTAVTSPKKPVKHTRGHLSREGISIAGLAVARKEGVHNLTMKRLAQELSVTPMAIYRHFEDKSDLIDAVLERFVQENDILNHTVPQKEWARWLKQTYTNMYIGLQSMPSVYPYLSSASRFGPSAREVVERTLEVMQDAGFSRLRSLQASNALNGYVIGYAIMDNAFYKDLETETKPADHAEQLGLDAGLDLIITTLQAESSDSNEQNTIQE